MVRIGVLALQGDVREHCLILRQLGAEVKKIKNPKDLHGIHGLIIPGGESTTIGKLLSLSRLDEDIIRLVKSGMPIYGTCAGAILMAKEIKDSLQPRLGLMEMTVTRNGYGRQADSFETEIELQWRKTPTIFIRAPVIESCTGKVLATHEGKPIFVVDKNMMVTTFHPELSGDPSIHQYFLEIVKKSDHGRTEFLVS